MTHIVTVTLPFPDAKLSPNSRAPWRKIEATKAARELAYYQTRQLLNGQLIIREPLAVSMYFYPPARRHFDLDNMISRCKAYQDGIFQALGLDDHLIVTLTAQRCDVVKGGRVSMEIESEDVK